MLGLLSRVLGGNCLKLECREGRGGYCVDESSRRLASRVLCGCLRRSLLCGGGGNTVSSGADI